jgi:hypothetical protein
MFYGTEAERSPEKSSFVFRIIAATRSFVGTICVGITHKHVALSYEGKTALPNTVDGYGPYGTWINSSRLGRLKSNFLSSVEWDHVRLHQTTGIHKTLYRLTFAQWPIKSGKYPQRALRSSNRRHEQDIRVDEQLWNIMLLTFQIRRIQIAPSTYRSSYLLFKASWKRCGHRRAWAKWESSWKATGDLNTTLNLVEHTHCDWKRSFWLALR